jgi:hypothetical protein
MKEEFPIREEDEERIKNDFRLMKFRCIRCGFQDIEINEIEPHTDGINFRSVGQPAKPKKEQTSYDDLLDALRLSLKGYNIE